MPLSITDYKNWARQDQATTVSMNRDSNGLMAEKARLGFFARTFGGSLKTVRAAVFTELLAANFYWQETFGATLSWNAALEEVVLIFPLPLADATPESVETVFARFVDLQSAWAARFAALVAAARDIGPDADDDDSGEDAESGEAGTGGDAAKDNLIISP